MKVIIGPHAGFVYSGPNAGWAYRNINPDLYDRVVLLGPSHKFYLDFIGLTACNRWETPLGDLEIDVETVNGLESEIFRKIPVKLEENEHSLELHLPFIRKVF